MSKIGVPVVEEGRGRMYVTRDIGSVRQYRHRRCVSGVGRGGERLRQHAFLFGFPVSRRRARAVPRHLTTSPLVPLDLDLELEKREWEEVWEAREEEEEELRERLVLAGLGAGGGRRRIAFGAGAGVPSADPAAARDPAPGRGLRIIHPLSSPSHRDAHATNWARTRTRCIGRKQLAGVERLAVCGPGGLRDVEMQRWDGDGAGGRRGEGGVGGGAPPRYRDNSAFSSAYASPHFSTPATPVYLFSAASRRPITSS
ncbi:hypothetical protein C8F04DRAFT_1265702 [Mycena alexandri]|uniref:Uncharacterized protein n=1 Tax=Mycena alexandri TaxID=1745969 RepID=A0AAD6WZ09_9AGAR|nr:hypothetical protein C8F04DRAFT_1265702 [Mycena alexandri]